MQLKGKHVKNAVKKHCLKYVNLWAFVSSLYGVNSGILHLHGKKD